MGHRESRRNYYSRFDAAVLHAKKVGLKLESLIDFKDLSSLSDHDKQERVKSILLIGGADDSRFDAYKEWLHKKAVHGEDCYPKTLCLAMTGLDEHKQKRSVPAQDQHSGTSFQQGEKELVAGLDGVTNKRLQCWICNKWGHKKPQCPSKKKKRRKKNAENDKSDDSGSEDGNNIAQFGEGDDDYDDEDLEDDSSSGIQHVMMVLGAKCFASVKVYHDGNGCLIILFDTGSTHHVFCNPSLLKDIRHSDKPLTMNTNAGDFVCHGKGIFPGIGRVWYNPDGIINVLSGGLLEGSDKLEVTKHRKNGVPFYAVKNKSNGKVLKFPLEGGVFIHRVSPEYVSNNDKSVVTNYSCATIKTLADLRNLYTPTERNRAERAGALIKSLVYPSRKDLKSMIVGGSIGFCPVTVRDIDIYHHIYGGIKGSIQGKTVRKAPPSVEASENMTSIPKSLLNRADPITLCVDLFFIQGRPYFISM